MALVFSRRALTPGGKFSTQPDFDQTHYYDFSKSGNRWTPVRQSKSRWLAAVKDTAVTKDVLIHVHGFNTTVPTMLKRHTKIEAGLKDKGFKGVVVSYDWPNRGKGTPAAYGADLKDRAPVISRFLVKDGILELLGMSWRPRVHLVAHSMGALVITDGFSQFGDSFGPGAAPWKVGHIIMASGDAHRSIFEKGAGASMSLERHSRRLTNFNSRADDVLALATLWNKAQPRVGRSGLPSSVSHEHKNVDATQRYKDMRPDFGGDNSKELLYSHRWWFDSPWFYKRMAETLKIGS
ncbi:MAG: alpha/beta fold hydrolase [Pseudomonadota bacterium]